MKPAQGVFLKQLCENVESEQSLIKSMSFFIPWYVEKKREGKMFVCIATWHLCSTRQAYQTTAQ